MNTTLIRRQPGRARRQHQPLLRPATAFGMAVVSLGGAALASTGAPDDVDVARLALVGAMFLAAGAGIACAARGSQVRHHAQHHRR